MALVRSENVAFGAEHRSFNYCHRSDFLPWLFREPPMQPARAANVPLSSRLPTFGATPATGFRAAEWSKYCGVQKTLGRSRSA
jgi:hypothetical protein